MDRFLSAGLFFKVIVVGTAEGLQKENIDTQTAVLIAVSFIEKKWKE